MLRPDSQAARVDPRGELPRVEVAFGGRWLAWAWRDRLNGAALAVSVAALAALAMTLVMPRGPVTTGQTLAAMALGLGVGLSAGFLLRSRWAALAALPAFALVFELRWIGLDGPTVDAPKLDSAYGILALLLGRGFFALVGLLPMLLGVSLGAAAARRLRGSAAAPSRTRTRAWLYVRRASTAAVAAGLIALAVLIARPASTAAIVGPDGEPLAGSIARLEKVELGGAEQWLLIRGHSVDNPVLLYLSGGPGQTDMPQTRSMWRDLEQDFVIVNWDEPGVGKSYAEIDPTSEITLERAVSDTVALAEYLRSRFDEQKIYLVGESWGTILGVLTVERRPDLFHAYIGSGQMVDVAETDRLLYRDMLAFAERTGDTDAAAKMRGYGPPPYDDPFANAYVMGYYDELAGDYEVAQAAQDRYDEAPYGPWGILGSEYTLVEKVDILRSLADYFSLMYPQIQEIDLRRDAARLDVPVYLMQGRHELEARTALVPKWLDVLEAPAKRLYWFEEAGHATALEEFGRFGRIMTETVVPETYPGPAKAGAGAS